MSNDLHYDILEAEVQQIINEHPKTDEEKIRELIRRANIILEVAKQRKIKQNGKI